MKNDKRLKKYVLIAIAAILENIGNKPLDDTTTSQLARQVNINRKLLQEGFKEIVGMGIKEYRIMKRMEVAQQLLADGAKSIKEIAVMCRYKSQSAFTTAFKKLHGVSPTEWQDQNPAST
jgi:AraC-like DNA-binding protein